MPTIRIACKTECSLLIDQMIPFQGDLKSLSKEDYAKLRKEILESGFAFPIYVWKDGDSRFIIGGHQRVRVLKELRDAEGYEIPPVPVVYIEANNEAEAKRRVLQDVSQYGKVEKQGLYEFLNGSGVSIQGFTESFSVPEIDPISFGDEYFKDLEFKPGTETDQGKLDEKKSIVCPKCGHEFHT